MKDKVPLYSNSLQEAHRHKETALWRESHRENVRCRDAIELAIWDNFDGTNLQEDCTQCVIEEFGYLRPLYVLTATLQYKDYDGRFSLANKDWAGERYIHEEKDRVADFVVNSHPAVLDGFVNQFRGELQKLGLFWSKDCETIWQELEGKVLVMCPEMLQESYWSQQNQLWLATGGIGCSPKASGRAVYATCLGDGEKTRWNRSDFLGVLKEDLLPEWACDRLREIQDQKQSSPTMTMN